MRYSQTILNEAACTLCCRGSENKIKQWQQKRLLVPIGVGKRENYCCLQIWWLICVWALTRHLWGTFNVRAWVHLDCCRMVSVRNLLQSKKNSHWVPFLLPSCSTVALDLWTMNGCDPVGQRWGISHWIWFFLHSLCHKKQLWSSKTATCAVYWKTSLKLGKRPFLEVQPRRIHVLKSWERQCNGSASRQLNPLWELLEDIPLSSPST